MIDRLRLRNDVVLVLLAPNPEDQRTASGLIVERALKPVVTYGRVVKVGEGVTDVAPRDLVAFPATVGEPMPYGSHDLLFLREPDIAFVLSKD